MDSVHIITEFESRIMVDHWGGSTIYLNISMPMASMATVLTHEEAKELANALLDFAEAA